jgi:superfamily II DNA or RNA helicase
MSHLRQYQRDLKNKITDSWASGAKSVMGVLPTGGGKTVIMSEIIKESDCKGLFIAHRGELLAQASMHLARSGVAHDLILPRHSPLRRQICDKHLHTLGKNHINERGKWLVGSVDTVLNMPLDSRWKNIRMMITDEAHHLQSGNKWGRVRNYAPGAHLLGMTATPRRTDGRPLDMFDVLADVATMRNLIDDGYLCDYQILCPKTEDLNLSEIKISPVTGEYSPVEIKRRMVKSARIVGDVVNEYIKHASGKPGVTFAVDIEEAIKIARAFNAAGVPAQAIHAKTPLPMRNTILERYRQRDILQLVNVDLIGEGFDLPDIEIVSMVRPTMSLIVFLQQFGRALRISIDPFLMSMWESFLPAVRREFIAESKKPFTLLIDHVGNVLQPHLGLPDTWRNWSLSGRDKHTKNDEMPIPLRACTACLHVYERVKVTCPFCGHVAPLPQGRSLPRHVDGDLQFLDMSTLAHMRAEIARIDGDCHFPKNVAPHVKTNILRNHLDRQTAQKKLRDAISSWAQRNSAYSDQENHKRFYFHFKITVLEAMALGSKDAETLCAKILFH